jgi:hypothetical protein
MLNQQQGTKQMTNRLILIGSIFAALTGFAFTCGAFYIAGTNDGYDAGYQDARRATFNCDGQTVQVDNYRGDIFGRFQDCTVVPNK